MQTQDYIKKLNSNLSSLDDKRRSDIIKEIESYIQEQNATYETLVENFGSEDDLASNYLDAPLEKKSFSMLAWIKIRKVLVFIAISFILIVIAIMIFFLNNSSDSFDYSKYNSSSIEEEVSGSWKELSNIKDIKIEQAKVVFYSSDNKNIQYNCSELGFSNTSKVDSTFNIKQASCYVLIPKKLIKIKAFQSELILISPKSALNIDLTQGKIRMFENKQAYKYIFDDKQSRIDLKSKKDGILINAKLFQAKAIVYEY